MPHPDIVQAKRIEPVYGLLRLFTLRNEEHITLSLAAMRTLARQSEGHFDRGKMDELLGYLSSPTRARVFRILQDYGWIVPNGIDYEIPERVRSLLVFLYGALARDERDHAQQIDVSMVLTDLDWAAGTTEDIAALNFEAAIGSLRRIRAELRRALEQRSTTSAREALHRSEGVRAALDRIERRLREKNRQRYHFTYTTEIQSLCADIIALHHDLFQFIHQDIQANAKAFGQYLTAEQVEEFLQLASQEDLAKLIRKTISSPRRHHLISRTEILQRGLAYLQRRPEVAEPAPPPPVVDIVRREVAVQPQEGDGAKYYHELIGRLHAQQTIPLHVAVMADHFGAMLHRTGLLVMVRHESSSHPGMTQFEIIPQGHNEHLEDGPVEQITAGTVALLTGESCHKGPQHGGTKDEYE